MQVAVRSHLATGVAMMGASALVVSAVAPSLADVTVPSISSAAVEMSAAANPLQTWIEVFGQAAENLALLGQQIAERPAPILQQIIENQLGNVSTLAPALQEFAESFVASLSPTNPEGIPAHLLDAFELIAAGNPAEGVPAIFQAFLQPILFPFLGVLLPVQDVITQTAQNVLDVANATTAVIATFGLGALSPVASAFSAVGAAAQAVVDAATDGDPVAVVAAVLDVPGVVTGAILNGFGFDGGLLSPGLGTLSALLSIRDVIADALAPSTASAKVATDEVSSTSTDATTTVNFELTDGAAKITAGDTAQSAGTDTGGGAPTDPAPVSDDAPGEDEPTDETPAEEPTDQTPAEEAPADEPTDETPAEEEPTDEAPADEDSTEGDDGTDEQAGDDTEADTTDDDTDADDTKAGNDDGDNDAGADNGDSDSEGNAAA